MAHFAFFYFLLTFSAYITGYFKNVTIAPLVISYIAILYYFGVYAKTDNSFQFRSEILSCLLIGLFVFEIDNIIFIYFQSHMHQPFPHAVSVVIYACLVVLLVCIAGVFKFIPVITRYSLYLACISIFIINLSIIYFGATPVIDVHIHLKEAAEYFLAFKNPYSNVYTQVYTPAQIKEFYPDNPVFLKYVPFQSIPPVCIAIYALGYLLGDVRIINAILFCLIPIVLKNICSKIFPAFSENDHKKMALVLLLFPAQLYLVFLGWTDISLGFFTVLFIYFFLNEQKTAAYVALGIFLSLKQYSVVYFIPFVFIMDWKDWRLYLITGGIVVLPLAFYALWDPSGFIDSIILYELKQPLRPDSISIPALVGRYVGKKGYTDFISTLVLLLSFMVSVYYSLKKMPTLDSAHEKMKFMLYVILFQFANLLIFSKQSFLNQYYFLTVIFYLTLLFSIHTDRKTSRSKALPQGGTPAL